MDTVNIFLKLRMGKDPLVIENGIFSWENEGISPTLTNINIRISNGSLVAVVGSVGSGKSSLISAFLGEMYKYSGRVNTKGSIAYVPQQAWIQNATLRDNIIFGNSFDYSTYNKIIKSCALETDLDMLSGRDMTEIGEKGINLSGGQKQRVSLARAVYTNADIYFLDDPLSAVDSHVGKHIFDHILGPNGMLKDKTRVLVTHRITYLSETDYVIVLKNGTISESGTYEELLNKKGDFSDFLNTYLEDSHPEIEEDLVLSNVLQSEEKLTYRIRKESESSPATSFNRKNLPVEKEDIPGTDVDKLIETEYAETGNIKWPVYKYYLSSVGTFLCCATIFMNLVFQGFSVSSRMWLSAWSSNKTAVSDNVLQADNRNLYLGIYACLMLGQGIANFFADLIIHLGCWMAARELHNRLIHGIMRVPLQFMDTTPIGRILSRFSKDMDTVDESLPDDLIALITISFEVIAILFIISYSTPMFMSVILPIGAVYIFVQRFYVATSRQVKRLESISRSPIYTHFGETISGAQSIRAYGLQERFILEAEKRVDFDQKCDYLNIVSLRWLSVRLEIIGNLIIIFAVLFAVFDRDSLSPGLVGLSISYALQVTDSLKYGVLRTSRVETDIVSVERIKEYAETPPEESYEFLATNPPDSWPEKGEIVFQDYKVRYREGLDLVLKGVTFAINGGEKVGIVGRTGAGKSSLTLSIFRIIEAAGGKIIIDGIDISTLDLHTLRSRLTIIPQDPLLFSGTLRINLDPLGVHLDENIWHALELSHLKTHVSSLPLGLQHDVEEGGENFSVGQRQLICLARALLRKSKILVLDEATAAIDLETDDLIQSTIRKEFNDCTILTIAHRINTIMDYDRVIVLDKGHLVEFDSPVTLIKSKNSLFHTMAEDAGLA